MNDDQLTRLFRSLEEQADPDPAFNESLFERLEREAHVGDHQRRASARWALLAAALLVALAVGAAAAIGSGLVKLPIVAVESSSPEPSPTPAGSTAVPSSSASPSTTPLPLASIPEGTAIGKLIATHDGFLAIGTAPTARDPVNVLLRAPTDASTWQPVDDPGFGRIMDAVAGTSSEILLTNTRQDLSGPYNVWRSVGASKGLPRSREEGLGRLFGATDGGRDLADRHLVEISQDHDDPLLAGKLGECRLHARPELLLRPRLALMVGPFGHDT